ncbi:MAG: hypothetical protein FWG84_10155 [Bacteroidales bacterium]|nr:hypothetical protein [Bacteroidales bacterium]
MQIANPIYDTVFKYLMSDSRVAKALLSAIIGEQIEELDFTPHEYTLKTGVDTSKIDRPLEQITILRIDFGAKIKTDDGYKTVLIELQKAKLATDVMRFRRYLGEMYENPENSYDEKREKARQIYCVYFLNYEIGVSDSPIIKVDYKVSDLTTGEEFKKKNEFIASLNHKSWIIQVRRLKAKRRNELENLLSIFDQDNITDNKHILSIDESQFPEEYRFIIRKLREAYESKQMREEMRIEDDFFSELLDLQRSNENLAMELTKKDEQLTKKDEQLTMKDEQLTKKDEQLTKKDEELEREKEENKRLKEQLKKYTN